MSMPRPILLPTLAVVTLAVGCGVSEAPAGTGQQAPQLKAHVVQELPHDPSAFTQGLELAGGRLYEGTGLVGQSELRVTDPVSGAVSHRVPLPGSMFGEGITVAGTKIWQLTWKDGVAFQRDLATGAEIGKATYEGEGWGLCYDEAGERLVMSDGSDRLTFRDPDTFEPTGELTVTSDGRGVTELNELECVEDDTVFANVWQTNTIVRIDLASGKVTGVVDLAGLLDPEEHPGANVLNGIAAIPGTDEFLVTGKLWPKMFRVRFVEPA